MSAPAELSEISGGWLFVRTLFAFLFVVALIYLSAALARKYGLDKRAAGIKGKTPTLSVEETLYLDPRRRLVLVRAGGEHHLLLLSQSGDVVVASNAAVEGGEHAE